MSLAAFEQAITFLSRTDLIQTARLQDLPEGVTELLRICSGDQETLLQQKEHSELAEEEIRHAAEFYVQQILFAPDSNHYRILGVAQDDPEAKIKLHYRLLVRWLHPDKNAGNWEVVFSDRVNRAWHSVRTPERRYQYDQQLASDHVFIAEPQPRRDVSAARWQSTETSEAFVSAKTMKRLPIVVFSLLGICAVFSLWLFTQIQPTAQNEPVQAQSVEENQPLNTARAAPDASLESSPLQAPLAIEANASMPVQRQDDGFIASVTAAAPVAPVNERKSVAMVKEMSASAEKQGKAVVLARTQKPMIEKTSGQSLPAPAAILAANQDASSNKPLRKSRADRRAKAAALAVTNGADQYNHSATNNATHASTGSFASDQSVRQFLQRFSHVYEEGDYFALHNLFSRDLSIVGAPPQRSVLRSYRHLFENSQSRHISLEHITWLASDDNIVVIASYQAEVLPRGKAETESSRGDIRIDLRLENGQWRIVSLQSDSKNG